MRRSTQAIAIPGVAVAILVLLIIGAQIMDKASSGSIALVGVIICGLGLVLACVLAFLVER